MANSAEIIDSPQAKFKDGILIASDDTVMASDIGAYLEKSGFDVSIAQYDGHTLRGTPRRHPKAVLCCFKDYLADAPRIVDTLRQRYTDKNLTIIGAFSRQGVVETDIFDSVIFPPAHPAQIAIRVNSMIRLAKMEREIILRIDTLKEDFGIDYTLSEPEADPTFRILFIGKASPEFMVVINALENKNVEVIAAFTSFSAFDFLHETHFDAVVMNMQAGTEPALTISETMRRNARLYHVPTLFLTGEDFRSHELAYKKGATDIIPFEASQDEISGRILELANYHRVHQKLKQEFSQLGGERCIDPGSGTYNKLFFFAHLRRILAENTSENADTSMLVVRIRPKAGARVEPARLSAAYNQIGKMIKNMVRMEDVVARLDEHIFAIAFPAQSKSSLSVVVARISGIIDGTAFQSGDIKAPTFQVDLDLDLSDFTDAGPDAQKALLEAKKPPQPRKTG